MQLVLVILIVLIVLYVIGRLRKAFHFDRQVARETLSSDAASVRNSSGRVAYGVTASSASRLVRLQTRLEAYASSEEK